MLKRFCVVVFALSVFFCDVAVAHHVVSKQYPGWVDAAVRDGKRCKRWEPLMRKYGLPVTPFTYICWRESRANPKAWNKSDPASGSYGLWQINGSWVTVTANVCSSEWGDRTALFDPVCNAKVAAYLFREGGFRPWGW